MDDDDPVVSRRPVLALGRPGTSPTRGPSFFRTHFVSGWVGVWIEGPVGFGGRGTAGEEGHSLRSRNEETRARDVAFATMPEFFSQGTFAFSGRVFFFRGNGSRSRRFSGLGWGFRSQDREFLPELGDSG